MLLQKLWCERGGLHEGETLSMVCLQPSCLKHSLICAICLTEQHRGHSVKPLRIHLAESTSSAPDQGEQISLLPGLTETVLANGSTALSMELQIFREKQKLIVSKVLEVFKNMESGFGKQSAEIVRGMEELKTQFQSVLHIKESEEMSKVLKVILAALPESATFSSVPVMRHQEAVQSIRRLLHSLSRQAKSRLKTSQEHYQKLRKMFQSLIKDPGLFQYWLNLSFSTTLHHSQILVESETRIKSVTEYGYRFALLQPGLQSNKKEKSAAFRIVTCTSNWLAVGICHRQIVSSKSFGFSYSEMGHGGYLVSANGGSWSNIDATNNNTVKAFNFTTGDIIIVNYDPLAEEVHFTKESTKQSYVLHFSPIEGDELHFCALFYYSNDIIEYIPDYFSH